MGPTRIPPEPPLLDWAASVRLAGEDEGLAEELFGMLMRDLPAQHRDVLSAWRHDDLEALWDAAHLIHGGTAYCGVPALRQAARLLEEAIKTGERELIEPEVEQLGRVIAAMQAAHGQARR